MNTHTQTGPDRAVALTMIPETLECAEILLQRGSERTRDCAALLVNNLAGMGGEESSLVISKRPSLISELMHMIAIGNAIQLQRVTSTFNHLSRSAATASTLRRFQVHEAYMCLCVCCVCVVCVLCVCCVCIYICVCVCV